MLTPILTFAQIETFELTDDPEFGFTHHQKLSPVKAGAVVTGLGSTYTAGNRHRFFDEIVLNTGVPSFSYSHKPLLLYFYEQEWRSVATEHLRQLNALSDELYANNINLLVVTSASLDNFRKLSDTEGWTMEVFEDSDNDLAAALHLYSAQSPTWSSYSGIESNIALPALYLLDSARQVVLDFPNENIEFELPLDIVIPILVGETAYGQTRKSA